MDDADHASNKIDRSISRMALPGIVVSGMILQALFAAPASAQLVPWGGDTDVLVDQSVMGGGDASDLTLGPLSDRSQLLPPPVHAPRSSLLVNRPPAEGVQREEELPEVKLTPPSERRKMVVARPTSKPAPKKPAAGQQTAALPAAPESEASAPPPAPKMETPPAAEMPKTEMPTPLAQPKSEPKPEKPAAAMAEKMPAAPEPEKEAAPPVMETPPPVAAAPPPMPAKPAPKPAPAKKEEKVAATTSEAPPPAPAIQPPPAAKMEPPPPAPANEQQAARTSEPASTSVDSITFAPDDATLSEPGRKALDAIADRLAANEDLRMQLLAYAGDPELSPSRARRLSLSRALAVRSYLIGKGVRSTRIDVRALGNRVPDGSPNRVDLRVIER